MQNNYRPEGYLIGTPENYEFLSTPTGLIRAMERQKTLEAVPRLCDSECNLHFDLYGTEAIMPRSEVQWTPAGEEVKDIAVLARVGKPTVFRVIGRKKELYGNETFILSRRAAQEDCNENYLSELKCGDILPATVTHLENFGAFVDIGYGVVSLLSIDAISVSRISHPHDRHHVGDRIYVIIRRLDENGRIYVSERELFGTWEENAARFLPGETVAGIVRSIENYGIFVELAPNLAGLAESKSGMEIGDTVAVYIKNIIPEKTKIKLVIIDAEGRPGRPSQPGYFIDTSKVSHIDYWRYTPHDSRKNVETDFTQNTL